MAKRGAGLGGGALGALFALAALGCDDPPSRGAPVADAAPPPPAPAPSREGCLRSGPVEAVETDPTCVVAKVSEEAVRASMKHLAIGCTIEPTEVFAGGTGNVVVTITNTADSETLVAFEARGRPVGPRTDWARVAGIPEPKAMATETPKLFFAMTTTDARDRDVDALPTIPGSGALSPPTILAVHLRPKGKLTHTGVWWALTIPAPAPIVTDDAGHRYVPKTSALPLYPGDYGVVVEVPLYGLTREERKFSARVHVSRAPLPDGGTAKRW